MNYKLDGVELYSFGAIPHINTQERIALCGLFDLPKRKGTVEYNWGTSIEPFVDAEDIELDGRALTLTVCIKGASVSDYSTKLEAYKSACIFCRKLSSEFGDFDVVTKDALDVEEYPDSFMAIVTTRFWQQEYFFSTLSIKPSGTGGYLLDNFSLEKDFGIYVEARKSDKNISKRIEVNTTLPYTQTQYREALDITIVCAMTGNDLLDLYSKMRQFQALCMGAGIRTLELPGNDSFNLYFKDGISVKTVFDTLLRFDLKCRVVV